MKKWGGGGIKDGIQYTKSLSEYKHTHVSLYG